MILTENIQSLIPQRAPFVMIDHLISFEEKVTRSAFTIKEDNIFVENNRFCEAGLIENIAQTAAARAGYVAGMENKPVQVGYIGAIKNLAIHSLPEVSDILETAITIEHQVFDVTLIKGSVTCGEKLMAECEMKIFIIQSK